MSQYEDYFGLPDAAKESLADLKSNHLLRHLEKTIKAYQRHGGNQVIVGIKGSGKTDIRRYIEATDNANIFNLDADSSYLNIDANQLSGRSGRIKNTIALELVRAFAYHIGREHASRKRLRKAAGGALQVLKNIPDAVDITTPGAKINLGLLLSANAAPVVHNAWRKTISAVKESLSKKRGYIMIDDAEDVFPGIENNPDFLEGLARAVNDINIETGNRLHVLLFLKYGIWRQWFENQKEYDKVAHVIDILSWDRDALCKIVARRIAGIHQISLKPDEVLDVEGLWRKEFDWGRQKFKDFSSSITKYCVSGPRDMVVLCNMAKNLARGEKVKTNHFKAVLRSYSETQIGNINADFGDVYPKVHKFVDRVFQAAKAQMSGKRAADWIDRKGLTDPKVDKQFAVHPWFSGSSKEKLVSIMYEIGFLGKRWSDGRITYSIEQPNQTVSELMDSDLVIHPAFRPSLAIKDNLPSF